MCYLLDDQIAYLEDLMNRIDYKDVVKKKNKRWQV